MITDEEIVHLLTTRARGGKILTFSEYNNTQHVVDENHEWDFKNNTYHIVSRFSSDNVTSDTDHT